MLRSPIQSVRGRRLNLKAAIICALVATGSVFALHLLHEGQIHKTLRFLEERGERAFAAGDGTAAMTAWDQCLALDPGHPVGGRLAGLLAVNGTGPDALQSAWSLNEQILLNDPDNFEIRQQQADLAIRVGRFADAESLLAILRERRAESAHVWYLSGIVARQMEHTDDAVRYLRRANELAAHDPNTIEQLVALMKDGKQDVRDAENLLNAMVETRPSPDAFRVRAAWLAEHDRIDDAARDLWSGLEWRPDDSRIIGMLLEVCRRARNHTNPLLQHLEEQTQLHPDSPRLRVYSAHTQWLAGRQEDAIQTLRDGIQRNSREVQFHELLVDFHVSRGEAETAREIFDGISRDRLDHATWHFLQGRIHMAEGNRAAAETHFEKADGFAGHNLQLKSRAQLCLGICRRESGKQGGAVDAFRSVVRTDPHSTEARLGMAAAWLESGQTDLAIAEYRQLLDEDGVPALLASLLIRQTERTTAVHNDWREIESLLREDEPFVGDPVQRTLLQAELMFAQGLPAQALEHIDRAAERWPDNPEVLAMSAGLLAQRGDRLERILREQISADPNSVEVHAALLRILAERTGPASAEQWVNSLVTGQVCASLSPDTRLVLAAQAAEMAALALERNGHTAADELLLSSRSVWEQLARESVVHLPESIGFLARYQDSETLIASLNQLSSGTIAVDLQARCWVQALRNSPGQEQLREPAERSLRTFIEQSPSDAELWLALAEYLIRFERYDDALTLQRQALQKNPKNAVACSEQAWVLAVTGRNIQEALELSETAVRLAPFHHDVLAVRGLVLLWSGSPEKALSVFESIPASRRSDESLVYEALARVRLGQSMKSRQLVSEVHHNRGMHRWRPADRRLLESVMTQMNKTSTGNTSAVR